MAQRLGRISASKTVATTSVWTLLIGVVTVTGVLILHAAALQEPARPARAPGILAITEVTLVDPSVGAPQPNMTVLVRGNHIETVGPHRRVKIPRGALIVDGRNRFVTPGLWDAHAHMSHAGECSLELSIASGITSVRDLGGPPAEGIQWRSDIAAGRRVGPQLFLAGPNIESAAWMARAKQFLATLPNARTSAIWEWSPRLNVGGPSDVPDVVEQIVRLGLDLVKFRNLDADAFRALAAEARRRGRHLVGHAPEGITAAEAGESGLRSLEHGQNLVFGVARVPVEARDGHYRRMARSGMFVTPTLVSDGMWAPDGTVRAVIADSGARMDPRRRHVSARQLTIWEAMLVGRQQPDKEAFERALSDEIAAVRAAHRAGVPLLAGTDLGTVLTYPGSSLHEELELLVSRVGLTPLEALQTATVNPARFFGLERQMGAISAGMRADLVLLDSNPLADIRNVRKVRGVLAAGRYFDSGAIASLEQCGDVGPSK
jgi:imidazolonepropionase-like amidohydrolase